VIDRLSVLVRCFIHGGFLVAKKRPECSVEKTIAGIAQAIHEVREEGESTDRMVVALTKSVAALTVRLENAETAVRSLLVEVEELRKPARTWLGYLKGE
jgi:tRNA pseudouridine-54 N-methylase